MGSQFRKNVINTDKTRKEKKKKPTVILVNNKMLNEIEKKIQYLYKVRLKCQKEIEIVRK